MWIHKALAVARLPHYDEGEKQRLELTSLLTPDFTTLHCHAGLFFFLNTELRFWVN